jgi:hypothetical protein
MHPQLLLELDEGIASRLVGHVHICQSAQWTPSALQGIEELIELVQAVRNDIWLKLLLEIVVDALGIVVVNHLVLVLS